MATSPHSLSNIEWFALADDLRSAAGALSATQMEDENEPPGAPTLRSIGVDVGCLVSYLLKAKLDHEEGYVAFDRDDGEEFRIPLCLLRDNGANRPRRLSRKYYRLDSEALASAAELKDLTKALNPRSVGNRSILYGVVQTIVTELDVLLETASDRTHFDHRLKKILPRCRIIADLINWRLDRGGRPLKDLFSTEQVRQILKNSTNRARSRSLRSCLPLSID